MKEIVTAMNAQITLRITAEEMRDIGLTEERLCSATAEMYAKTIKQALDEYSKGIDDVVVTDLKNFVLDGGESDG